MALGATELALFTTARTLQKGTRQVELSAFFVPRFMPEAAVDVLGVKKGLTESAQLGFRTSLRLLSELHDPEEMIVAALMGISYKHQLARSGSASLAFNYVFPYTELIYTVFDGSSSFTFAGGTSLISLMALAVDEDYRDFFLRGGVFARLNTGMALIVEAGTLLSMEASEPLFFANAALRIGGDSFYLDLMGGVTPVAGYGGVTIGLLY